MIPPAPLFTPERLHSDIQEIEGVASLVCELAVPLDGVICEAFERLLELAGSRDFLPVFGALQYYLRHIQWARDGGYGGGSIVSPTSSSQPYAPSSSEAGGVDSEGLALGGLVGGDAPLPCATTTSPQSSAWCASPGNGLSTTVEESLVRLAQLKQGLPSRQGAWIVDPAEIIRMGLCRPRAYVAPLHPYHAETMAPSSPKRLPLPGVTTGTVCQQAGGSGAAFYSNAMRRLTATGSATSPGPLLGELPYEVSSGSVLSRMPPAPLPPNSASRGSPVLAVGGASIRAAAGVTPSAFPRAPPTAALGQSVGLVGSAVEALAGPLATSAPAPPVHRKSHKKKRSTSSTKKAPHRVESGSEPLLHRVRHPAPPSTDPVLLTVPSGSAASHSGGRGAGGISKPAPATSTKKTKHAGAWTRGQKSLDATLSKAAMTSKHKKAALLHVLPAPGLAEARRLVQLETATSLRHAIAPAAEPATRV